MKRTFIDAGVLVAAARGVGEISEKALEVLQDSDREFASSIFIKLEVLPKAVYNLQTDEAEFYETFFNAVTYWANDVERIIEEAYRIACTYGLASMDSLHVAAALLVGAEELVTTEKPTKPMYRVAGIQFISILD